jgi:hypothetical protein
VWCLLAGVRDHWHEKCMINVNLFSEQFLLTMRCLSFFRDLAPDEAFESCLRAVQILPVIVLLFYPRLYKKESRMKYERSTFLYLKI